jgi:hypothetical protein
VGRVLKRPGELTDLLGCRGKQENSGSLEVVREGGFKVCTLSRNSAEESAKNAKARED